MKFAHPSISKHSRLAWSAGGYGFRPYSWSAIAALRHASVRISRGWAGKPARLLLALALFALPGAQAHAEKQEPAKPGGGLGVVAALPAAAEKPDAKKPEAGDAASAPAAEGPDPQKARAGLGLPTKPLALHPAAALKKPAAPRHTRARLAPKVAAAAGRSPGQTIPAGAAPAAMASGPEKPAAAGLTSPAVPATPAVASASAAAPAGPPPAQTAPKATPASASAEPPKTAPDAKPGIPPIVSMPASPTPESKKPEAKPQAPAQSASASALTGDGQTYCSNMATTAIDARYAWQAKRLSELDAQLKQRISELDAKQAEYKAWLQKRDEFQKKADDNVVAIYSKMRPEAAASQLAAMDDTVAAAILAKLNARAAGLILNEMDAARAARLTNAMSGQPPAARNGKKS